MSLKLHPLTPPVLRFPFSSSHHLSSPLSPFPATHPKNSRITSLLATLPNSLDLKSRVCHTYKKMGGGAPLPATPLLAPLLPARPATGHPLFTPRPLHVPVLASIVLAGGAGALYLSQSSFWSVTADIAAGSSGSVSGFMNMGAQLGGAVTTTLTPIIASHFGWTVSFYVAAAFAILDAFAWLFVDPSVSLASPSRKPLAPESEARNSYR